VTWSLAIEEQFYIVWPWLVSLCSRKKVVCILGTILFLSPLIRMWARQHGFSDENIYRMTCFRLDGLSLGALIAIWCKSDLFSLRRMKWVSLASLTVGVPASLWLLGGGSKALWPLLYFVITLASAGLMTFAIWCYAKNSIFGRPFRASWLRYIGQISFCLYLVHEPVYGLLASRLVRRHIDSGVFVMFFGLALSIAIASLSWYLFESQILKLKGKLEYRQQTDSLGKRIASAEASAF
jgi:peptidoglycan/LPS O-acetylase OafA/YrhL